MRLIIDKLTMRAFGWGLRRFSAFPGRWRVQRWVQGHHAILRSWARNTIVFTSWGYRIRVAPSDYDGMKILRQHYTGAADSVGEAIAEHVQEGDCVLDIGANIGAHTLLASRRVGRNGLVHAFEPIPDIAEMLRANVTLNKCDNVTVHNVAVTDHCGEVEMSVVQGHLGLSSLRGIREGRVGAVRVRSRSIDSLLAELPKVSFVKVDVEGAEMMVLRGMRNLIDRDRPIILVEVTDGYLKELGSSANEVYDFLVMCKYKLFIKHAGRWVGIAEAPADQCDVLCRS